MNPLNDDERKLLHDLRQRHRNGILKRRNWTFAAMQSEYEMFRSLAERRRETHAGRAAMEWPEDERMLTDFYWMVRDEKEKIQRLLRAECPIGWFKPSWWQAQVLNSWHPDYDPDVPEGYKNTCNFGGKRALKTTATVINKLLWIIPNDPQWVMFEPYIDEWGREVRVLPRFDWDEWQRSGRRIFDHDKPPKSECLLWHGVPNENHWKGKTEPEYRKWMPDKFIRRKGKDREWYVADRRFIAKHGSMVACKLYDSDVQDWSGAEMFCITFDEGPTRPVLGESIYRTRYIQWAYTPAEASNIGQKAALAESVYRGKYILPGKTKFLFPKTSETPDFAIDRKLIKERVELATKRGEEGRVEVEGGFFHTSPLVFNMFDRDRHVLPWGTAEIVAAIRGEGDPKLVSIFGRANIIRGIDEGISHPFAVSWVALLRSGELVLYRDLEQSGLSIIDRARITLELTGSERVEVRRNHLMTMSQMDAAQEDMRGIINDQRREQHTGERLVRYKEVFKRETVRRSYADSKMFKRDPNYPGDDWVENYTRAGLRLERANNIGPAARCDYVNSLFVPDHTRRHLNPEQCKDGDLSGFKLYISRDCTMTIERMGEYLQGQFVSGNRKGEFTGKPAEGNEDCIDSLSYACLGQLRWVDVEAIKASMASSVSGPARSSVTGY